jgi:hypothetical protein
VLVLDQGRIVERGTHDSLCKKAGFTRGCTGNSLVSSRGPKVLPVSYRKFHLVFLYRGTHKPKQS